MPEPEPSGDVDGAADEHIRPVEHSCQTASSHQQSDPHAASWKLIAFLGLMPMHQRARINGTADDQPSRMQRNGLFDFCCKIGIDAKRRSQVCQVKTFSGRIRIHREE